MKKVSDYDELLHYVNRLGIVNKTKPIGWRQGDLCAIANALERIAQFHSNKPYPFLVKYHRKESLMSVVFTVNGGYYRFSYPQEVDGKVIARCIL